MPQRISALAPARTFGVAALTVASLATLSACGGGGGSSGNAGGTPTATVTAIVPNATKYASAATITINGTGLDSTLAVTSSVCTGMTLQAGSTATSATYLCTVSGGLTGSVIAKSNGTQVGMATLTVPAPIVRFAINNGLGAVGNIDITLAPDKAPKTVDNFLHYVNTGWYANTIFHRLVPNFVAQGGGYSAPVTNLSTATLKTGLATPITYENSGLTHVYGSIAMAATSTGQETSQYFFNTNTASGGNSGLNGKYTVFGSISAGTPVLTSILAAPADCTTTVDSAGNPETDCLPNPNVVVTTATQTQ